MVVLEITKSNKSGPRPVGVRDGSVSLRELPRGRVRCGPAAGTLAGVPRAAVVQRRVWRQEARGGSPARGGAHCTQQPCALLTGKVRSRSK